MNNTPTNKAGADNNNSILFFVAGAVMMATAGYLILSSVHLNYSVHYIYQVPGLGRFTAGLAFIPFAFGLGMIFYNAYNIVGWLLFTGAIAMLTAGVINTSQLNSLSDIKLIVFLGLLITGATLFLGSLRGLKKQ